MSRLSLLRNSLGRKTRCPTTAPSHRIALGSPATAQAEIQREACRCLPPRAIRLSQKLEAPVASKMPMLHSCCCEKLSRPIPASACQRSRRQPANPPRVSRFPAEPGGIALRFEAGWTMTTTDHKQMHAAPTSIGRMHPTSNLLRWHGDNQQPQSAIPPWSGRR